MKRGGLLEMLKQYRFNINKKNLDKEYVNVKQKVRKWYND